MRLRRTVVVTLALLATLAGSCTEEPEPLLPEAVPDEEAASPPPSGLQVGVVLPPGDPGVDRQLSDLQTDLRGLAATLPEGVHELRLLVADERAFVGDLARLLVQRGSDLVCVIGRDARRTVIELAGVHPEVGYCGAPAAVSTPPSGALLVEVRFEEVGHVVGVAAAAHAGAAPIGVVVGRDRVGRGPFLDGLRAAAGEDRLVEREPTDEEAALDAVREVLDEGAEVVVVDVGAGGVEALALAAEHAVVIAPSSLPVGDETVLSWRVRWDAVLRPVLEHLVNGGHEVPGTMGLAEEVLLVTAESAASLSARSATDAAIAGILSGDIDPLEPLEPEEPDEDGEDEPDDEPAEEAEARSGPS